MRQWISTPVRLTRTARFHGYISEVRLWRYDPDPWGFLDDCCIDRAGIDRLVDEVRPEGFTSEDLAGLAIKVLDLGTAVNPSWSIR